MRVCILGNGLSSLTLAKSLVNQKIYVDVLYSKKTYSVNKTRTIGISKSNVEFFNEKIINIEKIIYKLNKIEIYSDNLEKQKLINFGNNNDHLFSIVKNYKLQDDESDAMLDVKLKVSKKLDDAMTGFTPKEAKKVFDQCMKELCKIGLVKT